MSNVDSHSPQPEERDTGQRSAARGLELFIILARRKVLVLGLPLLMVFGVAVGSLFMTDLYTASAKLLPPQSTGSAFSALLSQVGGLAAAAGSVLGAKPGELHVSILRSRTLSEALVKRFDLLRHYGVSSEGAAIFELSRATRINQLRDNIITIEVDDEDPKLAADLANGYIEELHLLTQRYAVTEASRRRLFFEEQLEATRNNLAKAEIALKETQLKTGLIRMDEQGRVIIDNIAKVRGQISSKEVEIQMMRTFATEENPGLVRAQRELAELRSQLARLEASGKKEADLLVPTSRIPEAGLEYVRRVRDVKYFETLMELLAKQFEIAKLDEARDASIIQVLDPAIPPVTKSKPRRVYLSIVAGLVGLIVSVISAFVIEAIERLRADPANQEDLRDLRGHLKWSFSTLFRRRGDGPR
jgi:uncharacterized protein involved in exopolysaccharide biosynthesis